VGVVACPVEGGALSPPFSPELSGWEGCCHEEGQGRSQKGSTVIEPPPGRGSQRGGFPLVMPLMHRRQCFLCQTIGLLRLPHHAWLSHRERR
jgi:hypothetical protein